MALAIHFVCVLLHAAVIGGVSFRRNGHAPLTFLPGPLLEQDHRFSRPPRLFSTATDEETVSSSFDFLDESPAQNPFSSFSEDFVAFAAQQIRAVDSASASSSFPSLEEEDEREGDPASLIAAHWRRERLAGLQQSLHLAPCTSMYGDGSTAASESPSEGGAPGEDPSPLNEVGREGEGEKGDAVQEDFEVSTPHSPLPLPLRMEISLTEIDRQLLQGTLAASKAQPFGMALKKGPAIAKPEHMESLQKIETDLGALESGEWEIETDQDVMRMMKAVQGRGLVSVAFRILEAVRSQGIDVKPQLITSALLTCAKAGSFRLAFYVLKKHAEQSSKGLKLDTQMYNALLDACLKAEEGPQLQVSRLLGGEGCQFVCLNIVVCCCEPVFGTSSCISRTSLFVSFPTELAGPPGVPNNVNGSVSASLLGGGTGYFGADRQSRVWLFTSSLPQASVRVSPSFDFPLLAGTLQVMLALLQEMKTGKEESPGKGKGRRRASRNDVGPDTATYCIVGSACATCARPDTALELWKDMKLEGLRPPGYLSLQVLRACEESKEPQRALSFFDGILLEAEQESADRAVEFVWPLHFGMAVRACLVPGGNTGSKEGRENLETVWGLLGRMERLGLMTENLTFHPVFKLCAQEGAGSKAVELLGAIEEGVFPGVSLDYTSQMHTLFACQGSKEDLPREEIADRGIEIFQRLRESPEFRREISLYRAVFHCIGNKVRFLAQRGSWDGFEEGKRLGQYALDLRKEMESIDGWTVAALLRATLLLPKSAAEMFERESLTSHFKDNEAVARALDEVFFQNPLCPVEVQQSVAETWMRREARFSRRSGRERLKAVDGGRDVVLAVVTSFLEKEKEAERETGSAVPEDLEVSTPHSPLPLPLRMEISLTERDRQLLQGTLAASKAQLKKGPRKPEHTPPLRKIEADLGALESGEWEIETDRDVMRLMKAVQQRGLVSAAFRILEAVRSQGIAVRPQLITSALQTCAKAGSFRLAFYVLKKHAEQSSKGLKLDTQMYNALLDACLKAEEGPQLQVMLALLQEMKTHKEESRGKGKERGKASWQRTGGTVENNVGPDAITYCAITSACATCARPDTALELWKDMKLEGMRPSGYVSLQVLRACEESKEPQRALSFFDGILLEAEQQSADRAVEFVWPLHFGIAVGACLVPGGDTGSKEGRDNLETVWGLLGRMERLGLMTENLTFHQVFKLCAQEGAGSKAVELLGAIEEGVFPGVSLDYTSQMHTLFACQGSKEDLPREEIADRGIEIFQRLRESPEFRKEISLYCAVFHCIGNKVRLLAQRGSWDGFEEGKRLGQYALDLRKEMESIGGWTLAALLRAMLLLPQSAAEMFERESLTSHFKDNEAVARALDEVFFQNPLCPVEVQQSVAETWIRHQTKFSGRSGCERLKAGAVMAVVASFLETQKKEDRERGEASRNKRNDERK
uniref:Pentacotripeptide-repeat region of PRORP domain-containing protein n=1 Tax=Chromera velia CCMP2878 TaxID=1169474 RepID=A0A0G4F1B3_9ALVE|eukprot:Cvel_14576.t1-p1 / transcript=Cvel_14576.t1 / gene=Cvel_14576 / organism=Chromera_velia_CCMP2878 / gene_product=hypothetical protein / transcript_product=hypothetical protein / location=Cvel_scaffold1042:8846-13528(+) / protein_length=1442 / sequence_SO=supercontig / SO=protein_coding / is_pseudo=false